ncbi:MAG: DoxX family protein [Acidimicrobiia bacterium]
MEGVVLVGRFLFALIFVSSGVMAHLVGGSGTVEYARSRGVAAPGVAVRLSGVWIIAAGLSVAIGVWADLGALMISAFTLSAAFLVHHFWTDPSGQPQQQEMTQFMKDLALAGAGLIFFGFFAATDGVGLMVTSPLFEIS